MLAQDELTVGIEIFLKSHNKKILLITSDNDELTLKHTKEYLAHNATPYTFINITMTKKLDAHELSASSLLIIAGFSTNSRMENIYLKYQPGNHIKLIVICNKLLLHPMLDHSLYFAPLKNNKVLKHLYTHIKLASSNITTEYSAKKDSAIPSKIETAKVTIDNNCFLNKHCMTKDTIMIQMLADRILQSQNFKEYLFKIVYASRKDKLIYIAASNAITALNTARVSFSKMNLRDICIQRATLKGMIADRTDFSNANLDEVDFTNAFLNDAIFHNAKMDGLIFGANPDIMIPESQILGWPGSPIAYSEQDKILVTTSKNQIIFVWDTTSGKLIKELNGHKKYIRGIKIDSDGRYLITYDEKRLLIWDFSTLKLINHVDLENGCAGIIGSFRYAIVQGDKIAAIILHQGYLKIITKQINYPNSIESDLKFINLKTPAFMKWETIGSDSHGRYLALGAYNTNEIYLAEEGSDKEYVIKEIVNCPIKGIIHIDINSTHSLIAFAHSNKMLAIWNMHNRTLEDNCNLELNISKIKITRDGRYVLCSTKINTILIFSIKQRELVDSNKVDHNIFDFEYDNINKVIILSQSKGVISFKRIELSDEPAKNTLSERCVTASISENTHRLLVANSQDINIYLLSDLRLTHKMRLNSFIVNITVSQNYIIAIDALSNLYLYDINYQLITVRTIGIARPQKIKFSKDEKYIVIANDKLLLLLTLYNFQEIACITHGHFSTTPYKNGSAKQNHLTDLTVLQNENILLTAGEDGHIRKWYYSENSLILETTLPLQSIIKAMTVSCTNIIAATCDNEKTIFFNLTDPKSLNLNLLKILEVSHDKFCALSIAYSPNGKYLALASINNGILILYSDNDREWFRIDNIHGHKRPIINVFFDASNNLVSVDNGGIARKWIMGDDNKYYLSGSNFHELFANRCKISDATKISMINRNFLEQHNSVIESRDSPTDNTSNIPTAYK